MSRRTVVVLAIAVLALAASLLYWFRPAPPTPVAILEPGQVAENYPFFPFQTSSEELSRLLSQAHRPSRDAGEGGNTSRLCVVVVGGGGLMDPEANRPTLELSDGQRLTPAGSSIRVNYLPDKTTAERYMAAFTFRLPAAATPARFRAGDIEFRCKGVPNDEFVRYCELLRTQPVDPPKAEREAKRK